MSRARALGLAVALLAVSAPTARAGDVAQVRLGSTLVDLVVGTDGGAWVQIMRERGSDAIGRAFPDGRFVTAGVEDYPESAALGPDGQAWFKTDAREFVRSDAAGALSALRLPGTRPFLGQALATGPDGALWVLTPRGDRLAHVTPAGAVTYTPAAIPACERTEFGTAGSPIFMSMQRASDGAMWIVDNGCSRFVRVAAAGTTQFPVMLPDPGEAAPDAAGGMWFAGEEPGHVDAAGRVRRFRLPGGSASGVAVAPDGSAWFATAFCRLARITPDGEVTSAPTPIPAQRIGFDPAGGMWLASSTRLVHVAPGEGFGACDETAPSVRVNGGRDRISLRELRRGVRVVLREPAVVTPLLFFADDEDDDSFAAAGPPPIIVEQAAGRTLRVTIPARRFARFRRMLAAGKRPLLGLNLRLSDRDGNTTLEQFPLRVRR